MNKIKALVLFATSLFSKVCEAAYEPSGRGYDPNPPDIGLPKGNEVFIGLIIGALAIVIGQLLVRVEGNETCGCIGVILHFIGIAALIPLVMWICAIGQVILGIIIGVGVIAFIIALVFSKKKRS